MESRIRRGGRGQKRPWGIALEPSGNTALTGAFAGTIDFGLGPLTTTAVGDQDVFVALFDGTGRALASERFGDRGLGQQGFTIAMHGNQSIAVGGWFDGTLDFGGHMMTWEPQRLFVAPNDPSVDGFVAVMQAPN